MISRKGFSLFELLVAITISLVIGSAVVMILVSQIQITSTQNRNIINQEELRETLNFIGEEIRAMGAHYEGPFITDATSSELEFVGDLDGDEQPDKINYLISGSILSRTIYSTTNGGLSWSLVSTDTLLDNLSAGQFRYFAFGETETNNPAEITSIEVSFTLDVSDGTSFNQGRVAQQSLATRVTILNRLL